MLRRQRTGDAIHIRLSLLARYARLETGEDAQVMSPPIIKPRTVRDRNPKFRVGRYSRHVNDILDNPDDRKVFVIEADCAAHDLSVRIEAPPPQSLAYHNREDFVRIIFFRQKHTAENRLDAEHREKGRRRHDALNSLRLGLVV